MTKVHKRKDLTKGLLKVKVDVILTDMVPSDVYVLGAFINAATVGNQESPYEYRNA
jgi:hypothetical protein